MLAIALEALHQGTIRRRIKRCVKQWVINIEKLHLSYIVWSINNKESGLSNHKDKGRDYYTVMKHSIVDHRSKQLHQRSASQSSMTTLRGACLAAGSALERRRTPPRRTTDPALLRLASRRVNPAGLGAAARITSSSSVGTSGSDEGSAVWLVVAVPEVDVPEVEVAEVEVPEVEVPPLAVVEVPEVEVPEVEVPEVDVAEVEVELLRLDVPVGAMRLSTVAKMMDASRRLEDAKMALK
jgi:hypothetical protein